MSEKEELELLRGSAARFMTDPLERAFFKLQSIIENPHPNRLDSILPTSAFYVLAECLIELHREIKK
jgi:hypothetical protein